MIAWHRPLLLRGAILLCIAQAKLHAWRQIQERYLFNCLPLHSLMSIKERRLSFFSEQRKLAKNT